MFARLVNYVKESKAELGKVTWPTKKQAVNSTITVIVISAFVAVFLGGVDYVLNTALQLVITR